MKTESQTEPKNDKSTRCPCGEKCDCPTCHCGEACGCGVKCRCGG